MIGNNRITAGTERLQCVAVYLAKSNWDGNRKNTGSNRFKRQKYALCEFKAHTFLNGYFLINV